MGQVIATRLGLPVSSTHIAVGGVSYVGFPREYLKVNYTKMVDEINDHHHGKDEDEVQNFLNEFKLASIDDKRSHAEAAQGTLRQCRTDQERVK